MKNTLEYKGYNGSVEYSPNDNCLYGKILSIRYFVTYEATKVEELENEFKNAVDEYLEDCKELGKKPDTPYKGSFNVRIKPELHQEIALYAMANNKSLNATVEEALDEFVHHKAI